LFHADARLGKKSAALGTSSVTPFRLPGIHIRQLESRCETMSNDVDILVGRQLRRRRRILGLTQQQVGEAVGVRFQQIQKYECASNRMSVAMLWKLACVLDVDLDYFFSGASRHGETRPAANPALVRSFDRAA
jgi:DNA-binding XRE family transcriptional regulator